MQGGWNCKKTGKKKGRKCQIAKWIQKKTNRGSLKGKRCPIKPLSVSGGRNEVLNGTKGPFGVGG